MASHETPLAARSKRYDHRSARVILIDDSRRVLLLKNRAPGEGSTGYRWHTPGGGVESGETLAEAAARELLEETGLTVSPADLGRPVAHTGGYADLGWTSGVLRDDFFFYRTRSPHPVDGRGRLSRERHYVAGHRWWTLHELSAATEAIAPNGLCGLVATLAGGHIPAEPVRLPWHH